LAAAADIVTSAIAVAQSPGLSSNGYVAEVDQALELLQEDELLIKR
jgi:hypothetical protein